VYVRLANPGNRIVGGQYARGRIETGATQTTVVIPAAAVTARSADTAAVFVLTGNRVQRRTVKLGERDDATGLVAVVSGLQSGERVLLNPPPDIGDGMVVSIAADTPRDTKR
jgi:membrane fusion protein, multidrug efflux system